MNNSDEEPRQKKPLTKELEKFNLTTPEARLAKMIEFSARNDEIGADALIALCLYFASPQGYAGFGIKQQDIKKSLEFFEKLHDLSLQNPKAVGNKLEGLMVVFQKISGYESRLYELFPNILINKFQLARDNADSNLQFFNSGSKEVQRLLPFVEKLAENGNKMAISEMVAFHFTAHIRSNEYFAWSKKGAEIGIPECMARVIRYKLEEGGRPGIPNDPTGAQHMYKKLVELAQKNEEAKNYLKGFESALSKVFSDSPEKLKMLRKSDSDLSQRENSAQNAGTPLRMGNHRTVSKPKQPEPQSHPLKPPGKSS